MSFVTTQPKAMVAAAGNLQGIGVDISAANGAAAAPSARVVPAATDAANAVAAG